MTNEDLSKRLIDLEAELNRERAVTACQNLMGHYCIVHNHKNMEKHVKDFALSMPDVRFFDRVGEAEIRDQFEVQWKIPEEEAKGIFLCHYLTNPVIQVAKDCKTERGVWWSPGMECKPNPEIPGQFEATWAFFMYAVDFIVEDGEWKIWHLNILPVTKSRYERGPVRDTLYFWATKVNHINNPCYANPYSTTYTQKSIPAYPPPYDTWDGDEFWFTREENC